jgi:hypothetical protein
MEPGDMELEGVEPDAAKPACALELSIKVEGIVF